MANPSHIVTLTNITTGYTIPTIPARASGIGIVTVCMYNGAGSASVPSSLTCNGKTGTWVQGDAIGVSRTRVASAAYIFLEADLSSISGQVVSTSGQTGTVKNMTFEAIQDAKQGAPTTSVAQYVASGTPISMSLTRAANSYTITHAHNHSGNLTSVTNPTKVGVVIFSSGGGLNYAHANDTATTATITTNASGYISAHSMNFEVFTALTVDDINGGSANPDIDVSVTNTATTTGLGTITSLTIGDGTRTLAAIPSMPSGDGTFAFTWPYADGVVAPLFGSVTATFGDGTNSAAMVGNTPVPSGYASVTFSGATDIGDYYLGHALTLPDGMRMYYPTTNGAVVNPDGSLGFTSLPYTFNAMLHNVHSGGDGTITSVTVDITATGVVVITGTSKNHYIGFGLGIGF